METLREQYGVQSLDGFGLQADSALVLAAGMMINYVRQTRPDAPSHIKPPRVYHLGNYMVLDLGTRRNLKIFRNIRDGSARGTLVHLLDRTCTPMGARLLRHWISYPLLDVKEIERRSDTVAWLADETVVRQGIREVLKEIGDLERIAGKISLRSVGPRDLVHLKESAEKIPQISEIGRAHV